MRQGIFYCVGLGPGDPELVTRKALRILRSVSRIYAVSSGKGGRSVSGEIVRDQPGVSAALTELDFPMKGDSGEWQAQIAEHASRILADLREGLDCAFVSIGDPMTYSTCSYLLRALRDMDSALRFEIVPGVNSWSVLSCAAGEALCEGNSELHIVPAHCTVPSFPENTTSVLIKTYRTRDRILDALPPDASVLYGENLGLESERILSGADEIRSNPEAYLSMLIVKRGRKHD